MTPALPSFLRHRFAAAALPLLAAALLLPGCSERNLDPGAIGRRDPSASYGTWRPALDEVPKSIAESDADLYRKIYAAQEKGDWGEANRLIAQLRDRSLLGHVLAARYLGTYKPNYAELRDWMSKYGDHPDADRLKRIGSGRERAPSRKSRSRRHAEASDDSVITTTSRKPKPRPDAGRRSYTARGIGTVQGQYQLALRRGNLELA